MKHQEKNGCTNQKCKKIQQKMLKYFKTKEEKVNLRRSDKYVALSNLSIYYT